MPVLQAVCRCVWQTYVKNVGIVNQSCFDRMAASSKRNLLHCNKGLILPIEQGRKRKKRKEIPMFGYVSKIASKLRGPSLEDREMAYLNASADRVDLEYRQRQVDRGLFRNRGNNIF
jgi:hypothetical protein